MTDESKKLVTYVVQMAHDEGLWHDIATVKVPSGSKRKTILLKALAETGVEIAEKPCLRALDAESAETHEPTLRTSQEWVMP